MAPGTFVHSTATNPLQLPLIQSWIHAATVASNGTKVSTPLAQSLTQVSVISLAFHWTIWIELRNMCVHLVNNRSKQFLGSDGLIFHTIILPGQYWYQSTGTYLYGSIRDHTRDPGKLRHQRQGSNQAWIYSFQTDTCLVILYSYSLGWEFAYQVNSRGFTSKHANMHIILFKEHPVHDKLVYLDKF